MTLVATCVALISLVLLHARADGSDDAITLTGGNATAEVTLAVVRPRPGITQVDIQVTARGEPAAGRPGALTVQAVMATHGHATPAAPAQAQASGGYTTFVHLMMPGRWNLLVSIANGPHSDRIDFPIVISG
ncbi:hypothetical protein [Streptomyces sp. NPDC049744]|uniref:hypothetical protein n=1 Tax=Streptomyces sp. NPDC049744 TaxID=3154359 RepID=UPI00343983B6